MKKQKNYTSRKNLVSEHVLNKLKQTIYFLETKLKTTGKVEKNNKEFGKTVEGFLKLGYDNDKLQAGFVNYDLGKTTVVNGSYKYTQDKLTLKPYTELEMEILTPTRIKFGNITEYKFNNDFKVKMIQYTSMNLLVVGKGAWYKDRY